ncbi:MAG: DUF6541 family protein [Candidatus Woesearchaeota archaeon]
MKEEYNLINIVIISLFLLSNIFYLNLNGLPISNPGNIKAADPFYHVIAVENIIDTKQWNYYDKYISLGREKEVSLQPPLYYITSAILTTFSNLPPWITLYFILCITMALNVIIMYLLTKEIFENEEIAILASIFSIFPIPLNVWLYPLYIGLWLQVPSNFFILTFIWLFIKYLKKQETIVLFFIGICLTGILLVHPQDLGVLFLPCLYLAYYIFKKNLSKDIINSIKKTIYNYLFLIIPFAIIFLTLLPRFLFVWGSSGASQYKFGFYGFRSNFFTKEYSGGLVFPLITFVPLYLIIIWFLSILQLYINKEKYKKWLFVNIYFFIITYVLLIFIEQPYYFARLRTLTPYILYPSISYFTYYLIKQVEEKLKIKNLVKISIILLFSLILLYSLPTYFSLKEQLKYEHISLQKWDAYKWIQENTKKNDKILFFGGVFQSEQIYTKRITALFDYSEYQKRINEYISTNQTPLIFSGVWGANTLRTNKIEKNFFSYEKVNEPNNTFNILDFEYLFFNDLTPEIANVNHFLISEYQKYGFIIVYNKNGFIIMKNTNKLT